jgi:cyclopropane fatty-acyl-phospholipid synthase-like methyltransferase
MVDDSKNIRRFQDLSFKDFKVLAKDPSLSSCQKIGFPDSYRKGKEPAIMADILSKIPDLQESPCRILDIGPGCGSLIEMFVSFCEGKGHSLELIDSQEMLDQLPDWSDVVKLAGYFPNDFQDYIRQRRDALDAIISYSVLHYVFKEGNIFTFIESCLEMLSSGGTLLLGDIPNNSKRRRFFSSERGVAYHKQFTQSDTDPPDFDFALNDHLIDDGILMGIMARYRNLGYECYVVEQSKDLPMANRREDMIIRKL